MKNSDIDDRISEYMANGSSYDNELVKDVMSEEDRLDMLTKVIVENENEKFLKLIRGMDRNAMCQEPKLCKIPVRYRLKNFINKLFRTL